MMQKQQNNFLAWPVALLCLALLLSSCTFTVDPLIIPAITTSSTTTYDDTLDAGAVARRTDGVTVLPTAATYVRALVTINVRSGPGLGYKEVGVLTEGKVNPVFGISEDGNWWFTRCPDHVIGCWITAGPSYTKAVTDRGDASAIAATDDIADYESQDDELKEEGLLGETLLDEEVVDEELATSDTDEAIVEDLSVRLLEGIPVELEAVVSGQLPDACTFIERTDVVRNGSIFRIRISTAREPNQRCAPMLTPFDAVVPLDLSGLSIGDYAVRIGNFSAPFTLATVEPTPVAAGPAVVETVEPVVINDPAQGINGVNVIIRGYLPDSCTEVGELNQRLEGTQIIVEVNTMPVSGVGCTEGFTDFERTIPLDVTNLAGGTYEVVVNGVGATFTWQDPNAPTATPTVVPPAIPEDAATATPTVVPVAPPVSPLETPTATLPTGEIPTMPTDVTAVTVLQPLSVYDGPSSVAVVLGQRQLNEQVRVIGRSEDTGWWRIECEFNVENNCWISADPLFTQPVGTGES